MDYSHHPSVVVTFEPTPEMQAAIEATLSELARITYLPRVDDTQRAAVLSGADALLAWGIGDELRSEELAGLGSVGLIQLISAGLNHVPFDRLPAAIQIAGNGGGWADPMAEHVLAMALALAKRLPQNHSKMASGVFDQQTPNRRLAGAVVAILGYGGIGQASARLFRAFGAHIYAVTRSGRADDTVERTATLAQLDQILAAADVLLISLPLTKATEGLIGKRELSLMKPDAILINVARAQVVDEDALYEHLLRTPSFSAGLDVWWQEPGEFPSFATRRPFFQLPNLIGSPHISAITTESPAGAARHAAENIARYLRGEPILHVADRADYLD